MRFRSLFGDRSCPLLSMVCRSAADPARTDEGLPSRPVVDASALRSSVTRDRSAGGHGKADHVPASVTDPGDQPVCHGSHGSWDTASANVRPGLYGRASHD